MQALILAAGMGRRLGKITENKTKGMVEVNGKTLLARSLDILTSFKEIERIVLVVGFAHEGVRNAIGSSWNGRKVVYVENPDYDKTNNIYSLFLAKKELCEDDTILLESDLIFERSLIERLIEDNERNLVLVAKWKSWMEGTVITLSENKEISQFIGKSGFDFRNTDSYYKTVNIYKFSKEFSSRIYAPFLEAYCHAFGHSEYYENILGIITFINKSDLRAAIINDSDRWYEIDDHNDLDIAETLFSGNSDSYLKRYGGFWRFTELKDFCYLVNPYFPTAKMLKEFEINMSRLLCEYPSTSTIQRKLASDMFECPPEYLLIGNGASELITTLLSNLEYKKIGIPVPTFHEYIARSDSERIEFLRTDNRDFSYTDKDLTEFSKKIDALVVVNPDNPTGNFIAFDKMIKLIEKMNSEGKTIVIDESFVDFADSDLKHTLIKPEILEKYKNLIVVKSIGKSYGVPGCRLGVLASANSELIEKVQKAMPVWNISSFGEFFLQIFHKYKKEYLRSIEMIIAQREKLFNELAGISFLRPVPSKANYILCEVSSAVSCTEIAQRAIEKNILIKDCSGKVGFENKNYIRVTVRDESDNSYFIKFLKELDIK